MSNFTCPAECLTKPVLPLKLFIVPKKYRPKIRFPCDEGAHPDFLTEWWYGHFSLADTQGREYGAMVAYFNVGLKILMVYDLETERFHHFISSSALHHAEGRLDFYWHRDNLVRTDPKSFSYSLKSYGKDISVNLSLKSDKPPLLGCGDALIEWSGGSAYYYSFTRMKAKGTIEISDRVIEVQGVGWMDHQWMTYLGKGGWDWFAVQLDNDKELVFWHIVNPDESIKSKDLTVMFADHSIYHTQDFTLERIDSWVSPNSGREYSLLWRVRQESLGLDLVIRAKCAQQEIRLFESLSIPVFPFWEGRTSISGHFEGEAVSGRGYAEQVRLPL
jgi:predicted secreted hydrolase